MLVITYGRESVQKTAFQRAALAVFGALCGYKPAKIVRADSCRMDTECSGAFLAAAMSGNLKTLQHAVGKERGELEAEIASSFKGKVMRNTIRSDLFSIESCRNLLEDGGELGGMLAVDALAKLALLDVKKAKKALEDAANSAGNQKVRAYASFRLECAELVERMVFGERKESEEAALRLWQMHSLSRRAVYESMFIARDALKFSENFFERKKLGSLIDVLAGKKSLGKGFVLPEFAEKQHEENSLTKIGETPYGSSAFYFRQTTRNGISWFIKRKNEYIPVTNTGKLPLQFVVCGPFSDKSVEAVARACRKLKRISRQEVVVKGATEEQVKMMQRKGFRKLKNQPEEALWSDTNFPELKFGLKEVVELQGREMAKLHNIVNKFSADETLTFEECGLEDWRIRKVIGDWARTKAKDEKDFSYLVSSNSFFLEYKFAGEPDIDFIPRLLLRNGEPIGFTLGWRISSDTFGVYVCVCSEQTSNLNRYMRWDAFKEAYTRDFVDYKNGMFGGSELASLYNFKKEFAPNQEKQMHSVAF